MFVTSKYFIAIKKERGFIIRPIWDSVGRHEISIEWKEIDDLVELLNNIKKWR
jgi:hypothetical protein